MGRGGVLEAVISGPRGRYILGLLYKAVRVPLKRLRLFPKGVLGLEKSCFSKSGSFERVLQLLRRGFGLMPGRFGATVNSKDSGWA